MTKEIYIEGKIGTILIKEFNIDNVDRIGTIYKLFLKTNLGKSDKENPFVLEGKYLVNKFSKIKLGKLIRKELSIENPQEIEMIIDRILFQYGYFNKIVSKIRTTHNLEEIYNYCHSSYGTISNSCMEKNGDYYTSLMVAMDKDIKIAYLIEDNILKGRAILWEKIYLRDKRIVKLMDRIYSSNRDIECAFIEWAKLNGYWIKNKQGIGGKIIVNPKTGEKYKDIYYTELKINSYKLIDNYRVPYLDTLQYLDVDFDRLYGGYWLREEDYMYKFTSTDGSAERIGTVCYNCGEIFNEDDIIYIDDTPYCSYCSDELFVYSDYLDNYIPKEDAYEITLVSGETIIIDYYSFSDNFVQLDGDYYGEDAFSLIEDAVTVQDGRKFLYSDIYVCENCGEDIAPDMVKKYGETILCKKCFEDILTQEGGE